MLTFAVEFLSYIRRFAPPSGMADQVVMGRIRIGSDRLVADRIAFLFLAR